jgi:DNA-binding phage protein
MDWLTCTLSACYTVVVKGKSAVKKSKKHDYTVDYSTVKTGQDTGRFATLLRPAMVNAGFSHASQLAEKVGVSREHIRKLLSNEAQPSKPLCFAIAKAVGINETLTWAAAQLDRLDRKFGHAIVAEKQGKNPRVAKFEPYLLALTEEQVPAALAMLKGLASSQHVRKAFTMDLASKPVGKAKEA